MDELGCRIGMVSGPSCPTLLDGPRLPSTTDCGLFVAHMDPSLSTHTSTGAVSLNQGTEPPAGIYCANPDCRTKAGERSRGHQSCRSLLCGHCCQSAARVAAEAGEQRPICKVHARRLHMGHKPAPKTERRNEVNSNPTATTSNTSTIGSSGGEPEELHDLLEKRARLEQSLKQSLTMIIWYSNGCEPLRIAHEVTTFPLFQLQDFPDLIHDLCLQPSSYIDTYNAETGQWEQHKISTVRTVEQDQRLLYRLRPSLLESLTDCPSLEQELNLQPSPKTSLAKRHPAASLSPASPAKHVKVLSNPTPVRAPTTNTSPQNGTMQAWDSPGSSASRQGTSSWSLSVPLGATASSIRASPNASTSAGSAGNASGSSNPIRRWPTDYTVHEIVEGFDAMANIMKADPSARQKAAFERVFPPCRYVKSTVGRAKLYWKRASQQIRDHYLSLPRGDAGGKWTNFVHLMDGRLVIEVEKDKAGDSMEADNETGEEDERADAAASLSFAQAQAQVPGTQPQIALQSPPSIPAHASLSIPRAPPPMSGLMPNPNALTHHASAPAMPMTTTFALDRSINMNRSSSSLSGAMTIQDV